MSGPNSVYSIATWSLEMKDKDDQTKFESQLFKTQKKIVRGKVVLYLIMIAFTVITFTYDYYCRTRKPKNELSGQKIIIYNSLFVLVNLAMILM